MTLAEPIEVTLRVVGVLDELGVAYLVGGSLASSLHGIPRATQDADLVAALRLVHVDDFVEQLASDFYADADMVLDAIRRVASFNVIHLATMMKVDVFIAGSDPLQQSEMARRTRYKLDGDRELWLASAEDIVVQKLDWYEKGQRVSERQWNDALGVLKVQGTRLDLEYIRKWAAALGLGPLCARLLEDAGLS